MATSRDLKAAERRQQILDVAKRLFASNGYHATSMRAINKEIGMAEALTYHYFPGGKLEILHTVLQEEHVKRVDDYTDAIQAMQNGMDFREAVLCFARKTAERFMKDKEFLQILIQDRKLLSSEQLTAFSQIGQPSLQTITHFLEEHAKQGQIREMDYEMAIKQLVYSIGFTAVSAIMFESPTDEAYDRQIEKIVDFTISLWST